MTLGDRIAVMKEGEVQQFASPLDIYERPANMYVAGFIGSPSMNFVPGMLSVQQGRSQLKLSGCEVEVEIGQVYGQQGPVIAGIRPEHWQMAAGDRAGDMSARVELLEPTGADTFATLSVGDQRVSMRFASSAAPAVGAALKVALDVQAISLFDPATQVRLSPA